MRLRALKCKKKKKELHTEYKMSVMSVSYESKLEMWVVEEDIAQQITLTKQTTIVYLLSRLMI